MTTPTERLAAARAEVERLERLAAEPDPLLTEAREICSAAYKAASFDDYSEEITKGAQDHFPAIKSTLAALRRGMELQRHAPADPVDEAWVEATIDQCVADLGWSKGNQSAREIAALAIRATLAKRASWPGEDELLDMADDCSRNPAGGYLHPINAALEMARRLRTHMGDAS